MNIHQIKALPKAVRFAGHLLRRTVMREYYAVRSSKWSEEGWTAAERDGWYRLCDLGDPWLHALSEAEWASLTPVMDHLSRLCRVEETAQRAD